MEFEAVEIESSIDVLEDILCHQESYIEQELGGNILFALKEEMTCERN